jgi:chitobiase/beta-hexosaminidase-like protein
VTMACATAGAIIYYTTDGTDPTTASAVYSGAISVASSKTVKAVATATGFTASVVGSAAYTIGSGGTTDFTTLCQGSLSAFTTLETTCLHANPDFVNAFFTEGFISCSVTGKEIAAGRVTYDATQGTACASAFGSLTCAQLDSSTAPAACASVLTGTVPNGSSCYLDEDCAAGWCDSTTSSCPGTCQAFAQLDQSCATATTCAPGLECDSTQICKAPSAVNGACPCQDGLWCDTSGGTLGTCRASLTSGACDTLNLGQCSIGHVCVGTLSTTCQALVGLGGDCTAGAELCGLGYSCDTATNTCVSFPKLGEACSASNPVCIGTYCDLLGTLKCLAYKHIGDACSAATDFLACEPGSTCDAGTSTCTASAAETCQAP